jgi:hypothetical protein
MADDSASADDQPVGGNEDENAKREDEDENDHEYEDEDEEDEKDEGGDADVDEDEDMDDVTPRKSGRSKVRQEVRVVIDSPPHLRATRRRKNEAGEAIDVSNALDPEIIDDGRWFGTDEVCRTNI